MTGLSRRGFYLFVALGVAFWALYLGIGYQFVARGLIKNDRFFHSDLARVVLDLCRPSALHQRTNVHPLFVLLLLPIGSQLAALTGSVDLAGVLLVSFAGGACVTASGFFLLRAGVSLRRALICSLLLGSSASHLFFGSLPDSFIFSALSIILLYWAAALRRPSWKVFIPAGILSFGILITNLAFAAITFGSTLLPSKSAITALRRWLLYLAVIVILSAALAEVQQHFWSRSALFFAPHTYAGESRFFNAPTSVRRIALREDRLFTHVFGLDWFGSALATIPKRDGTMTIRIEKDLQWPWRGSATVGVCLWVCLLIVALASFVRHRLYAQPLSAALAAGVLSQLALHTLYGDDLFLYGCNTCFPLIAWLAMCMSPLAHLRRITLGIDAALFITLALEIANNCQFVAKLLAFEVG